jgi:hypothetical protein
VKQVYRLESFADIQQAFSVVRAADDLVPMMEEKAMLHIDGESLMLLDSQKFVLADELRRQGKAFVSHCIATYVGKRFVADKLT